MEPEQLLPLSTSPRLVTPESPAQLLASYSFLKLHLHEGATRAIEAEWLGFVGSSFLRQAILDAVQLARLHRISGWIADDRRLGPVRPVDLEWITTHVLPVLVEIGVKRMARIEAEDPLNQMLINNTVQFVQQAIPFEVRLFTNVHAARQWACGGN